MELILWRHAEADPYGGDTDDDVFDLSRSLTTKGERQARRMADWLEQRLSSSTRVLTSTALRCQQTAAKLSFKVQTADELAPTQNGETLLNAARWPDGDHATLIVGHQPALGVAASIALFGKPSPIIIKKAGVWWIRRRQRGDVLQTLLVAVQSPDTL